MNEPRNKETGRGRPGRRRRGEKKSMDRRTIGIAGEMWQIYVDCRQGQEEEDLGGRRLDQPTAAAAGRVEEEEGKG